MNSGALVSVVIPTYNRAHLVGQAVESVLGQSYRNVEVLVVDDGSTDDTQAKLAQFGDSIRVITQPNRGPSAARNAGIQASRGEFVAFLDSDDLWLPSKIERQVKVAVEVGASSPCCLCNTLMRWKDRDITSFDTAGLEPALEEGVWANPGEVLTTRFLLFNQAALVRRKALEKVGGFDESLRLLEDTDLLLRLALEGPWTFLREPLVIWRETTGSCHDNARKCLIASAEPLVYVLNRHVNRAACNKGLWRLANREYQRARRQLRIARILQDGHVAAQWVGRLWHFVERVRRSAFRRSAQFPHMVVSPVGQYRLNATR